MSMELVSFQIGDSVVVKEGTRDPDDESVEMGGWQGRIEEINHDPDGNPLVSIQWDGPTLREMSLEFVAGNLMLGLDYSSIYLGPEDFSLATPRDTLEEAEAALAEVEGNIINQVIPPEAQESIIEYTRIRDELIAFHNGAVSMLTSEELTRAAKQLGFLQGENVFTFDSEEETSILMDFALYELRRDRVPIIQCYTQDDTAHKRKLGLGQPVASLIGSKFAEDDAPLLDVVALNHAVSQSFTSLFQIDDISPDGLALIDLLDPQRPSYRLVDIGLMSTGQPKLPIFSRLIPIRNFPMTAGAAFCFPARRLEHLLRSYRNAVKGKRGHRVDVERYQFFHRANRRFGLEMWYK